MVGATALGRVPSDTKGLRTATIVLFWCVSGMSALLLIALISRRVAWSDFRDGDASFADLDSADDFVEASNGILSLVILAALIVLSIWAYRTARHAKRTGAADVSPGLSCGGWYIPFANAIVPFVQLRRVARHRGRSTTPVGWWQGALIGAWVLSLALRVVSNEEPDSPDDLLDRLTAEVALGALLVVALVIATVMASRAMKQLDADA
jgi:hypothetical protein